MRKIPRLLQVGQKNASSLRFTPIHSRYGCSSPQSWWSIPPTRNSKVRARLTTRNTSTRCPAALSSLNGECHRILTFYTSSLWNGKTRPKDQRCPENAPIFGSWDPNHQITRLPVTPLLHWFLSKLVWKVTHAGSIGSQRLILHRPGPGADHLWLCVKTRYTGYTPKLQLW
jgi:hypothetical protein